VAPRIELSYFDGCPSYEALVSRLGGLLSEVGLSANIELRRVETPADDEAERFLGSPTLPVDGIDVEPGAGEREDFGLKCRLYRSNGGLSPVPPDDWIRSAVRSLALAAGTGRASRVDVGSLAGVLKALQLGASTSIRELAGLVVAADWFGSFYGGPVGVSGSGRWRRASSAAAASWPTAVRKPSASWGSRRPPASSPARRRSRSGSQRSGALALINAVARASADSNTALRP
jgi:hypothetical protein